MTLKLNFPGLAPEAYQALASVNTVLQSSSLGVTLIDLVFLRISQVNGCAFCVDKHAHDLLEQGIAFQRINGLVCWREAPCYSESERAALAWSEALTQVATQHVSDDLQQELRRHFSEKELVELAFVIGVMNAWNRVAIACGKSFAMRN
ncbi:carboxymuconolactone decarboxylase family protein [Undibacterium sp. TS12]|uniref:carboxymuconolactone decarboxylase family protein n=1 Tax=Undibacterium sp. TS12 TaxID=2908202 RepID=UPI001F4D05F3|nr:carboxymuconolactone decarboxylase family protein [Undibacterium sp. TS12]MCH8618077.1 carboxymuconolactone decarboxylase family protein [Undibacterium sp. TS12]